MPRSNRLDRSVSMDTDNCRSFNDIKTKTRPSSLMGRWRSFRNSLRNEERRFAGDSLPEPDDVEMMFFETEDDAAHTRDELGIKICKDTIRQTILDHMRMVSRDLNILPCIENTQLTNNDLANLLKNSARIERNVVFLWCAFLKKCDLLVAVEQLGVDLNFSILGGLTAVHLSAFSGCVRCLRWLIQKGCDINLSPESYSPLHCAVLGNSVATTNMLLRAGAELKDSVLHSAVRVNAVECLTLLTNKNINVNSLDSSGMAPLHIAADRRMKQCLEILLDCDKINIDLETKDGKNTALHLASEGGYADCVSMLLAKKATVDKRNVKLQTPLHLAAKFQGVECVEALLKAGSDVNAVDLDNITPLRAAVGKALMAYNTVEVLIASGAEVNVKDKYGFTALHVAALNELSKCVDALILKGADVSAKTKGGLTCLNIISRKTPACLATICKKLDSSISLYDPKSSNREVEVKLDFRYLLQHSSRGDVGLLKTFLDEGQKEMLSHPLCGAFLCIKWQKIRRFYFCRLFLSTILSIFFTLYVMSALAHNCYNAVKNISVEDKDFCRDNSFIGDVLESHPKFMEVSWYILLLITCIEILRKLLRLAGYRSFKQYFMEWSNIIEWYTVFSVFATSFIYTGRTYMWQNHVGAFGVLCAWANLMGKVGQHPSFGTYVAMFTKVQSEFAKLFMAYAFLLIGFTVSFCVIFPKSEDFKSPLIGFVKVLVLMTGWLDMEMLYAGSNGKSILLDISSHITYVLFVIFVTVVLMNLLVGNAVQDIEGLHKTAGLSKLVRQTELISFLELALFQWYVPRKIMNVLRLTSLVSPSAFRVVLHVKPLNPRENRLPKNILMAAHEIARKRRNTNTLSNTVNYRSSKSAKEDSTKQLEEEVRNLKVLLSEQQQALAELLHIINRK
ncbi:transient receptor potential channel pyrexia-like [Homalodisca vitripennis]|uniref:transient receptor potential channel pyrexia-like n=1 Tax=Homalodisca vitripennis TaxID=197043 RepID=UPI001EEC753F|nr:transient receptor potential channel pyrexia-like [Homalodisca vitripennis]